MTNYRLIEKSLILANITEKKVTSNVIIQLQY